VARACTVSRLVAAAVAAGFVALSSGPAEALPPPPPPPPTPPINFGPPWSYSTRTVFEGVGIGDVTGDGRADLLATTSEYWGTPSEDRKLHIFAQIPSGELAAPVKRPLIHPGGGPLSFDIADFNGDGRRDVAVATTPGIHIFEQRNGTLVSARFLSAPGRPIDVTIANVRGTRAKDLIVSTEGKGLYVLERLKKGWRRVVVTSVWQEEIELGDVTGDGRADLVGFTGPFVNVFRKLATGGFARPLSYRVVHGYMPRASGIEIGDVTGDGNNDIIATIGGNLRAENSGSLLNVFVQRGGVLYGPDVYYSYEVPQPVEVVDMNGDGRKDVVTLHGGWEAAGLQVQRPDGFLDPVYTWTIPDSSHYDKANGLAVGDLNGDGRPDIAIAGAYNNQITVLRQTG
jgi:hypothetical protein